MMFSCVQAPKAKQVHLRCNLAVGSELDLVLNVVVEQLVFHGYMDLYRCT